MVSEFAPAFLCSQVGKVSCFTMTPPSLSETTASLQCVHPRWAQLPAPVPVKAQLQARSSCVELETLKCGSRLSARLLFLTPFCREGADHGDCRCGALDTRASQQMVAPTNYKHCTGRSGRLGPCAGSSPQLDDVYLCRDSCERIYLCVVLGPHPGGQLQWK